MTTNRRESLAKWDACLICGDRARLINYGALSCSSCKTFFRSNALRADTVRECLRQNACQLTKQTRRVCTCCRLAKCLSVGMDSDLIRKEDKRTLKYLSANKSDRTGSSSAMQLISVSQLSTFDLLRNDRSNLSTTDWTLLSNAVHAHDTFSRAKEFRSKFSNEYSSSPKVQFNAMHALDFINSAFVSMCSIIRSIPYFQVLTLNEQNSLTERNLFGAAGLYSFLLSRDSGLLDDSQKEQHFQHIYDFEIVQRSRDISRQLDLDATVVKLMLIIITFSTSHLITQVPDNFPDASLLFGTYRLFGSQNVFVEILWKYINHRYGSCDAVRRFTRLVSIVLDLVKYSAIVYTTNQTHHDLVDNIIEETKETLTISQKTEYPLWGKQ